MSRKTGKLLFAGIILLSLPYLAMATLKGSGFLDLCKGGLSAQVVEAIQAGADVNARDEFGNTRMLHIPMQHVLRIEEVEKKGQSAIRDAATGEKVVTPFPVPAKPR